MTEPQKYEALIKWLADNVAQMPENIIGYIDLKMKEIYPELNTPSGEWGLHRLLDRAFSDQYIAFKEKNDVGIVVKWYSITDRGLDFAGALTKRQTLFANTLKEYENFSEETVLDMALYWFAIDPKDYKGGLIIPRVRVAAETAGENMIDFYFKELNSPDFILHLDLILDQLSIDGYLYKHIGDGRTYRPTYSITYNGKKFNKEGGYRQKQINDKAERKGRLLRENLGISGTWLAGIAASGVVVIEAIKYWKWISSIELWTSFFVLLACVLLCLIAWQLIKYQMELKDK